MNSLEDTRLFVRKTQKRTILSGLAVGILLTVLFSRSIGFAFLAGVAIGIVNFQLMSVDAYTILEKTSKKARKYFTGRSFLRFALMFGFLAVIAIRTELNIIAAFIGVFYGKVVLFAGQIIEGLQYSGKPFGSNR